MTIQFTFTKRKNYGSVTESYVPQVKVVIEDKNPNSLVIQYMPYWNGHKIETEYIKIEVKINKSRITDLYWEYQILCNHLSSNMMLE